MKNILVQTDPILAGGPPFRRLFLDSLVTEESRGLRRTFHAARKHRGNPVLEKEMEWEGWGPAIGGTVLRIGDRLRMYYYCIQGGGKGANACVAESLDGLHWTRPVVGDVEWNGSRQNNITARNGSVLKVAEPDSPERGYLLFTFSGQLGAHMMHSSDGLRWKLDENATKLFSTGDVTNYFWDPYKKRFVATWKSGCRRHRAVGVAWSEDGLEWTKPYEKSVFRPDELDPDALQVYGMPVFPYQGMYIGLAWMYHARWLKYGRYTSPQVMYEAQEGSPRNIDVELAWSHDLVHWTRTPGRKPFIPNGPSGRFDHGMVITAREPVLVGDELHFYYGGFGHIHDDDANAWAAIGLATLRLDGFCSMRAGDKEGWLISRREVFNVPRIAVNARCAQDGFVTADIVDRNNNVLRGFSRRECVPFAGDSIRGEITWKTGSFPKALVNKDRKIRFHLRNADLFSYLPADIDQDMDDGWPDW